MKLLRALKGAVAEAEFLVEEKMYLPLCLIVGGVVLGPQYARRAFENISNSFGSISEAVGQIGVGGTEVEAIHVPVTTVPANLTTAEAI